MTEEQAINECKIRAKLAGKTYCVIEDRETKELYVFPRDQEIYDLIYVDNYYDVLWYVSPSGDVE